MDTDIQLAVHRIKRGGEEAVAGAIKLLFAELIDNPGPGNRPAKKRTVNELLHQMQPGEILDLLWGGGFYEGMKSLDSNRRIVLSWKGPSDEFAPGYTVQSETGRSSSRGEELHAAVSRYAQGIADAVRVADSMRTIQARSREHAQRVQVDRSEVADHEGVSWLSMGPEGFVVVQFDKAGGPCGVAPDTLAIVELDENLPPLEQS
jgi:hypothetical protein